ncbi:MAG: hypothetical protein P8J61_07235 [Gammaproteobacteria bacterium]|jgi:hypothetical protein|nr:hypothetical protein [Gammaproteobacteria bacterium]
MMDEDSIIDEETLLKLFKNNNSGTDNELNSGLFIQRVMQKINQELLIRTIVLSVIIGICTIFLFPQLQTLVSTFNYTINASFTYFSTSLSSSLPLFSTSEGLHTIMLPISVLTLSLLSIVLLDWSTDY